MTKLPCDFSGSSKSSFDEGALNIACGAVLGALCGDAAGATLEFLGRKPSAPEVKTAMRMVGGGVWKTAPGQVTDDGELTLALGQALTGQVRYDPNRVAYRYRQWFLSKPFDVGGATTNALGSGNLDSANLADTLVLNARKNNESKANGSLMRVSVLGVWSASQNLADTVSAAKMDSQLTHPNPSCQWASAAYVIAIRHLMLNPGDALGAFNAARDVVSEPGAEEVSGWLDNARSGILPAFHPLAGFVRIAFTHAFHHLIQNSSYESAIFETLLGGGDTDTNACIVGGLIGALHGESSIPHIMRNGVLMCDTLQGRPRPAWLQTTQVAKLIPTMLNVSGL